MTVPRKNLEQKEESPGYRDCLQNARLLRELPRPAVPAELSDPSFLEGIYERAAQDDLGEVLAEALPRRSAPEEGATGQYWEEHAGDRPELVAHFRGPAGTGSRAPGWLWQRIQADVRRQQAGRRQARTRVFRLRAAAAAAVLLMLGGGLSAHLLFRGPAAPEGPGLGSIRVQPLEEPLGQAFHPNDRLRLIAGGGK